MPGTLSEEEKTLAAGYVLGDLTDEETARLEQLMNENPDLIREIYAMQTSFELLPQALPQLEPPASLWKTIVASQPSRNSMNWLRPTKALLRLLVGLLALTTIALTLDNLRLRYQLRLVQDVSVERVAAENSEILYCGEFNTDQDGSVFVRFTPPKTPPKGVKATELFVTIDTRSTQPDPLKERVMAGSI